jgi:hypothetical protein
LPYASSMVPASGEQHPADATALRGGPHRERPDLCLIGTGDHLARKRLALQRHSAQQPVSIALVNQKRDGRHWPVASGSAGLLPVSAR